MKKITSLIILLTVLISSAFGQANAMKHTNNQNLGTTGIITTDKSVIKSDMMKKMHGTDKLGMKGEKMHKGGMDKSDMMKKMNTMMKKISDSLDNKGKEELKIMRKKHMSDMKAFKNEFKGAKKDEKMKAMKEMKKRHFADLKEILKSNIDLYNEVTGKMENMMKNMMKKMHGTDKLGMKNTKMHKLGMKNIKKRLFSSKIKNDLTKIVNRIFLKLDRLSSEKKDKKIKNILLKLDKAKSKIETLKNTTKKAKLNDIIDFLKEQFSKKTGNQMMNMN